MVTVHIPAEAYHRDDVGAPAPCLSKSIAHLLVRYSPAHAKAAHPKLNPTLTRDDEPKFDIGQATHSALLEGIDICDVLLYQDWRTSAAKEARAESRAHGRIPLLPSQYEQVKAMVDAANEQLDQHHARPRPFTDGKPEQTLTWQEGETWCKARLDWLRDDLVTIDDYKTTAASANPWDWGRTMFGMGGELQAYMYTRACEVVHGRRPQFRFVVQEVFPPYALSVVDLEPGVLEVGRAKFEHAVALWQRCLDTGEWPAYPLDVASIELPPWEEARWLERSMA